VRRWSDWFRVRLRDGATEQQLSPDFADYEANDLLGSGATEEQAADYERADPSHMAVAASQRYWRKYHPAMVGEAAN
jgi:hypothetical protein